MLRSIALIVQLICIPLVLNTQNISGVDFISPFYEGFAAVKKGDTWGFVDTQGHLTVDFRTDLVLLEVDGEEFPVFNSGRCLIMRKSNGISYYGYIDHKGNEVLKPQYLNATHFNEGLAIILKLYKNILGRNDVLDKTMVAYDYMELAINPNGEIVHYLSDKPIHITLSKFFMDGPPPIRAKFLNPSLVAIKDENNKWSLKKV